MDADCTPTVHNRFTALVILLYIDNTGSQINHLWKHSFVFPSFSWFYFRCQIDQSKYWINKNCEPLFWEWNDHRSAKDSYKGMLHGPVKTSSAESRNFQISWPTQIKLKAREQSPVSRSKSCPCWFVSKKKNMRV